MASLEQPECQLSEKEFHSIFRGMLTTAGIACLGLLQSAAVSQPLAKEAGKFAGKFYAVLRDDCGRCRTIRYGNGLSLATCRKQEQA